MPAPTDGDAYEEYPEDYEGPKEDNDLVQIATHLKAIGNDYFKKGDYTNASAKYDKVRDIACCCFIVLTSCLLGYSLLE